MKRSKTLAVKSRVVRRVTETSSWLRYVNEGAVTDAEDYECVELAYPELHRMRATRQPRSWSLSRRKLRARLYRLGYRRDQLAHLVRTLAAGSGNTNGQTWSGWSREEALEKFSRRVARELRRGVAARCLFLDEMGYYVFPGFAKLVQALQSQRVTRNADQETKGTAELEDEALREEDIA